MTRYLLRREGGRTAMVLVLAALAGLLFGAIGLALSAGLVTLLLLHLWYAAALAYWLRSPQQRDLPDGTGVWQDIYTYSLERHKRGRKRKKKLASIVKEFRSSTAALPDAAVVLDRQGCIVWFNQAAVTLLALRSQRDIGQRVGNLLRHPDFSAYYEDGASAGDGVEIPSPTLVEGTLWLRIIPYGDGQRLLIARDVTERKRLEESRRDFVANASHELRTPLTVLRGYLDMMGEEASDNGSLGPWHDPIEEMRRQSARMQQIITDLLKLANLEAGGGVIQGDEVDMPALIGAAMEEAELMSDGQHSLTSRVDEQLRLQGDQAALHSIIGNLLSNALRYTPAGGAVSLSWQEEGGDAVLRVRDTGIGIAARDIPRLTERFYRADAARSRETGGTGLGLAIVKHALERHEGQLQVQSQAGRGSEFSVRFPRKRIRRVAGLAQAG